MKLRIAQLCVTQNIQENLSKIQHVLGDAQAGEWVLFPEGMISGYYPEDESHVSKISVAEAMSVIATIQLQVAERSIKVVVGTAYQEDGQWYNVTLLITQGGVKMYKKNNLSTLDRHHFTQGGIIGLLSDKDPVLGIQMCRELVYPEQWRLLRQKGAQVILHINNAIKTDDKKRESLLIARAFENQCWVCSVNNAAPSQTMRSMVINPVGDVVWASQPTQEEVKVFEIDETQVQNVYLDQARTNLVKVVGQK